MAWKKTNDIHYQNIADSIRYAKDGTEYTTTLERARAEIERYTPLQMEEEIQDLAEKYVSAVGELGEDTAIFNDISTAIQSKTGQVESYEKNEMAEAISDIAYPPILESKVITPELEEKTYTPTAPSVGFDSVTVEGISENIKNENLDALLNNRLTVFTTTAQTIPRYFVYGKVVETAILPNATRIEAYSFMNSEISSIFMPNIVYIGDSAFRENKFINLEFSQGLTTISDFAFFYSRLLTTLRLPKSLETIGAQSFRYAENLATVDLTDFDFDDSDFHIPTLASTAFFNCENFIILFKNQSTLEAYAAATNWSALASRFQIKGE